MIGDSGSKAYAKRAGGKAGEEENGAERDRSLPAAAFLGRSLSDENRLRVLCRLRDGRLSVSSLTEALQLSQPLVSHHLKELKRSLLVKVERNGPFVYYELADKRILEVIRELQELAEDLLANRRTF